jgi:hypothetical protein
MYPSAALAPKLILVRSKWQDQSQMAIEDEVVVKDRFAKVERSIKLL